MALHEKIHHYLFDTADSMEDSFHLAICINHLAGYFDENFSFTSLDDLIEFVDGYITFNLEETPEESLYQKYKTTLIHDISTIFNEYNSN